MKTTTLKKFVNEIERRGGETVINHMPYGRSGWKHVEERELKCIGQGKSEGKTVYLLGCDGYRYYSRRYGSGKAALRYLAGKDDSGLWATRVPGTCESVKDAIDFIVPSVVPKARAKKLRVLRQGNLYLVETPKAKNHIDADSDWYFAGLSEYGSHTYYKNARVICHPEHTALRVPPGRWQAVEQKSLATNRGAARD